MGSKEEEVSLPGGVISEWLWRVSKIYLDKRTIIPSRSFWAPVNSKHLLAIPCIWHPWTTHIISFLMPYVLHPQPDSRLRGGQRLCFVCHCIVSALTLKCFKMFCIVGTQLMFVDWPPEHLRGGRRDCWARVWGDFGIIF